MKVGAFCTVLASMWLCSLAAQGQSTSTASHSPAATDGRHRAYLPMPNTIQPRQVTYDARDPETQFPPIERLRPLQGAPNVLIVLIDDAGFGSSSAFGGPCATPVLEKLALAGLKYNRFHTTALCSPTRQALLTGRNHHSVAQETVPRFDPDTAGRPMLVRGNTQILFGGMGRLSENCVLSIKNKSHSVTAELEVPASGAEGVVVAQAANIGGWSLYAKGGKLKYCYNLIGVEHYDVESAEPLPAGQHQVRMEFDYDGGGTGEGGTDRLERDRSEPADHGNMNRQPDRVTGEE